MNVEIGQLQKKKKKKTFVTVFVQPDTGSFGQTFPLPRPFLCHALLRGSHLGALSLRVKPLRCVLSEILRAHVTSAETPGGRDEISCILALRRDFVRRQRYTGLPGN